MKLTTWYDELCPIIDGIAQAGNLAADTAANIKGCLWVTYLGMSMPGMIELIRGALNTLAGIEPLRPHMEKVIHLFDVDVVVGPIMVEILTEPRKE